MNDIGLNRQFVETDDEKEACRLLSEIFDTYYKIVFNTIDRKRWNHPDTVIDLDIIVSETFIKAFNKRKQIGEPEKLLEWLIRVAENLMIDAIRKSRQKHRLPEAPVGTFYDVGKKHRLGTSFAETDAEYTEVKRERIGQLLRLLQGPDRQIVAFMREGLSQKAIAQNMGTTPGAVEKRWKRLRIWVIPVMRNLEDLIDCLPEATDRKIMERYFDRQSLSEITAALGVSCATVAETVRRVIKQWKKAAKDNPEDPVSAMMDNEK